MFIELKSFCFSVAERLRSKINFVFYHRVSVGRKSFCFSVPECSWPKIISCFSVPECLWSKIIFVFPPSQSVCGRKSFLFFYHRVSAVGNHFCFFVTECLRPNCKIVFASAVCATPPFIYMLKPQTHRSGIFITRASASITAPLVTQTEGEFAAPNAA